VVNARKAAAFHLAGLDTRYAIYIDTPGPIGLAAAESWIPFLCLDADDWFEDVREARRAVAKNHAMPPLLLVGIGYGASHGKPGNRRLRDYTPVPSSDSGDSGGAGDFLGFITETLWPEIERRYPLRPTIRGIAGHSLGGLCALHALFRPDGFFNRVLASAPSIWWGHRVILDAVAEVQANAIEVPARLFVGIGTKDGKSMIADVDLLESRLLARPVRGLEVRSARFSGYTHFSAIPVSFRTGLRELFT
jgi:predicted alpha/beta superfamily hydrolase